VSPAQLRELHIKLRQIPAGETPPEAGGEE
jgi:hypothetical protein